MIKIILTCGKIRIQYQSKYFDLVNKMNNLFIKFDHF